MLSFLTILFMILQKPTPWVVATLLPIVGGVALASVTEASFNWYDIFIYFCFITKVKR